MIEFLKGSVGKCGGGVGGEWEVCWGVGEVRKSLGKCGLRGGVGGGEEKCGEVWGGVEKCLGRCGEVCWGLGKCGGGMGRGVGRGVRKMYTKGAN